MPLDPCEQLERQLGQLQRQIDQLARIQRAEQQERRDDLELVLHGFEVAATDLDRLANMTTFDPRALHDALASGREVWQAHTADEDPRRRDHIEYVKLRKKGLSSIRDESARWRRSPRAERGHVAKIKAAIRTDLIALGIGDRGLRERLIGAACRYSWRYLPLPSSVLVPR